MEKRNPPVRLTKRGAGVLGAGLTAAFLMSSGYLYSKATDGRPEQIRCESTTVQGDFITTTNTLLDKLGAEETGDTSQIAHNLSAAYASQAEQADVVDVRTQVALCAGTATRNIVGFTVTPPQDVLKQS